MTSIYDWSTTPASNATVGSINWAEGQLPSTVNNSSRQEMADVAAWRDLLGGAKISATADTMTLTSGLSLSAYAQGNLFAFECGATNTGAVTINVDSLGAKAIVKNYNVPLVAGDLVAGGIYIIAYEATAGNFQLLSPVANNGAYETGTFTPAAIFTTNGDLSVSLETVNYATYTKIGRLVHFSFDYEFTLTHTTASGGFRVDGLPFASANDTPVSLSRADNVGRITNRPGIVAGTTSDRILLAGIGDGVTFSQITESEMPTATAYRITVAGTYETA